MSQASEARGTRSETPAHAMKQTNTTVDSQKRYRSEHHGDRGPHQWTSMPKACRYGSRYQKADDEKVEALLEDSTDSTSGEGSSVHISSNCSCHRHAHCCW